MCRQVARERACIHASLRVTAAAPAAAVQDYVGIYGLKMWQEEYTRVINFNVERECNRFLKKKILDANSKYQSRAIPIPRYAPLDPKCVSFMGRLLQAVLALTDARETVYAPECVGWYEASGRCVSAALRLQRRRHR